MRELITNISDSCIAIIAGSIIAITIALVITGLCFKAVWVDLRQAFKNA